MEALVKLAKRYRQLWALLGIAMACFIVCALVWLNSVRPYAGKCFSVKICDNYENFAVMEEGLTHTFTTSFDVQNLTYMFRVEGEQPQGELEVVLEDAVTGEQLATSTGVMGNIVSGQYTGLGMSALADSQGADRQYRVTLTPHYQGAGRLAVGYSAAVIHEDEAFAVDGVSLAGNPAQYISSAPIGRFLSLYYWAVCLLLTGLLCGIYLFTAQKDFKLHLAAFALVLGFGVAFTMALPPYATPDEQFHINESFTIASWWANRVSRDEWVMQDVPIFYSYRRPGDFNSIIQNPKTTVFTWKEYAYHLTDTTPDKLGDHVWLFEEQADNNPHLYFFSALGVFLGFCLHLGFAPTLLLGRAFNLLVFALLAAWAVKKAPFGKMAFLGASLLPMTLHLAASFSRDSLLLGCCFAFTALCLDLAYSSREKPGLRQLLPLAVLAAVIAPAKLVYLPLLGLALLIPAARARHAALSPRNKKRIAAAMAALLAVFVLFAGWRNRSILKESFSADQDQATVEEMNQATREEYEQLLAETGGESVIVESNSDLSNAADEAEREQDRTCYTLSYILAHPLDTLMLCVNSVIELGDHYLRGLVGGSLSYYSLDIAWTWVVLLYAMLALCALAQPGEGTLTGGHRVWAALLVLACCGLAVLGCVCWTPVRYTTIYGLQGRYFLPVLPLALLVLAPRHLRPARCNLRSLVVAFTVLDCMVLLNILLAVIAR